MGRSASYVIVFLLGALGWSVWTALRSAHLKSNIVTVVQNEPAAGEHGRSQDTEKAADVDALVRKYGGSIHEKAAEVDALVKKYGKFSPNDFIEYEPEDENKAAAIDSLVRKYRYDSGQFGQSFRFLDQMKVDDVNALVEQYGKVIGRRDPATGKIEPVQPKDWREGLTPVKPLDRRQAPFKPQDSR
jgi:hypothetical protein